MRHFNFARKIVSILANLSLLLNSFLPFVLAIRPAYAQSAEDLSPTPTPVEIIEESPTPTPEIVIIETPTPTPEVTPEVTPTITPEVTPEVTPTIEPTATPENNPSPEPQNNENQNNNSPEVTPEVTPTVLPTITPTPNPVIKEVEQVCFSESDTVRNSVELDWNYDATKDIYETREKVQLGVKYIFPQDNKVTVTFNCLPKDELLRSTLKIKRVKTSDLKLPTIENVSDYAYDITTDMRDGSFKYDITLPKLSESTAKVSYIEKSLEEATLIPVAANEVKSMENLEQQSDLVKATDVDHFTIFITTGVWPTTSDDDLVSGEGTAQIRWPKNKNPQSGLGFVGVSGLDLESLTSNGNAFTFGTLTHYNHPVSAAIIWADLKITLGLSTPRDFTFRVQIDETSNTDRLSDCTSGFQLSNTPCDDKVTFPNSISNQIVTVGGIDYTLIIDGFKKTVDGATLSSFITEEDKDNSAFLVGHFTPVGRIIVDKVTNPAGDNTSFSFTTTGAGYNAFSLTDSATPNNQILPSNRTYSVSESIPSGWTQTSVNCVSSIGDTEVVTALELDSGETITCTFSNTSTVCKAGTPSLEGKIKNGNYTTGNLCAGVGDCWSEGEDVPARITIPGMIVGRNYSVTIQHDYSLSGTIGYEYFHTATSGNGSADNISLGSATSTNCGGGVTCKDYVLNFTAQSTTVQLDWLARLSNQAGNWSGASLHYRLTVGPCGGAGNKDIPINPGKIIKLGSITVIKSTNNNANPNDWSFNITGNTNAQNLLSGSTANNLSLGTNNGDATYTITEVGPTNSWFLESVSGDCIKTSDTTASVVLTSNKPDVSCTFINKSKTGLLIVHKTTLPTGDSTVFTTNLLNSIGTVVNTGTVTDALDKDYEVTAGTYSVTETVPTGWTLTSNTCTNIVVAAGGTQECTITNTKYGSLTIIENSLPDDSQDFSYTANNGLNSFSLDDDSDNSLSNIKLFSNLLPGTYSVTQAIPTGWDLNSAICTDGSANTNISLSAGENITCTFTNTKRGSISGHKFNDADGNALTLIDRTPVSGWTIELQKDGIGSTSIAITNQNGEYSFTNLLPGNYVLTESDQNGWYHISDLSINVVLNPGESLINKDFINSQLASITVYENLDTDGDGNIDITHATDGIWNINSAGGYQTSNTVSNKLPGSYTISEQHRTGYYVTSLVCNNGINYSAVESQLISLSPNQALVCTFTNTKINPVFTIDKTADVSSVDKAGDVINYKIIITNSGNQTLTGVSVTDPLLLSNLDCDLSTNGIQRTGLTIDVGSQLTCTGSYTVKQSDIDAGIKIHNIATADTDQTNSKDDSVDVDVTQSPALQVVKSSTTTSITHAGQIVDYKFEVKNTGNQTLTGITVTDNKCDAAPAYKSGDTANTSKLDLTETWVYSCSHTVTQLEIDAGGNLTNTVTADSTESESDTDTKDIPITLSPKLTIKKSANVPTVYKSGDVINYTVVITNTGNQTLTGVSVVDPLLSNLDCDSSIDGNQTTGLTLNVGAYLTCTGSYTITPLDINNNGGGDGDIDNTATVDTNQTDPQSDSVIVLINGSITIIKDSQPNDPQDFKFTGSLGIFYLDDDSDSTLSNTQRFNNKPSGTYTITEPSTQNWDLNKIECTGGSDVNTNNRDAVIKLKNGENVVCTFVNTRHTGTIELKKVWSGTPSQTTLKIGSAINGNDIAEQLTGINGSTPLSTSAKTVFTGTYYVSESGDLSNYNSSISCSNNGSTVTLGANNSVAVGKNQNIICTITNTRKTGNIKFDKVVKGGSSKDSDWIFDISGQGTAKDGNTRTYNTGSYTVTESGPSDYTLTGASGVCHLDNGSIILDVTTKGGTCTITNTRDTGTVTVIKKINPTSDSGLFNLKVDGSIKKYFATNNSSTGKVTVITGNHTISEEGALLTDISNYSSSISCYDKTSDTITSATGTSMVVNVAKNKDLICTITNVRLGTIIVQKQTTPISFETFDYKFNSQNNSFFNGDIDIHNKLTPGTYTITEDVKSGWYLKDLTCSNNANVSIENRTATVTVTPGSQTICTFHNAKYGKIIGVKFNDKDADTRLDILDEPLLNGWQIFIDANKDGIYNDGERSTLTTYKIGKYELGAYRFDNLLPGTYQVCEVPQVGWYSTSGSNCQTVTINSYGGDIDDINFSNRRLSNLTVYKFNDLDGDGFQNEDEETLSGWTINLSDQKSKITEDGNVEFTNLMPGNFVLSENLFNQSGWKQTNIYCDLEESIDKDNSHEVLLASGQNKICYIGNQRLEPKATITKSNNSNGVEINPGGLVEYSINVSFADNSINNLKVTDLLSNGFKYKAGSYKVYKTSGSVTTDVTSSVTEPEYHSPGVWDLSALGVLTPSDSIKLVYTADISTDQQAGKYADLAWSIANYSYDSNKTVLALAGSEGHIDTNFVGTQVLVGGNYQNSVSAEVKQENHVTGQVLGASTELPGTGAATIWMIISGLLGLIGFSFLKFNKKTMLTILLTLLSFGLIISPVRAQTSNLSVRLEEPKTPSRIKEIELKYVALDIQGRGVTAYCLKKGPTDSSFVQFSSEALDGANGNASHCSLTSAITDNGPYQFQVKAVAGGEESYSNTVSLDYNTSSPGTPVDYRKEQINNCDFKIHFKTADDSGKTVKVELYRSTDSNFSANNESLVVSTDIGSNQEKDIWNNVPDCSKTYYYALRAFDSAGNGSGLVGDKVYTTITDGTTTVISTTTNSGAIPVSGTVIPKEGEGDQVNPDTSSEEGTGQVLGTRTVVKDFFSRHPVTTILIAILILGIIIYAFKKIRKGKKVVKKTK